MGPVGRVHETGGAPCSGRAGTGARAGSGAELLLHTYMDRGCLAPCHATPHKPRQAACKRPAPLALAREAAAAARHKRARRLRHRLASHRANRLGRREPRSLLGGSVAGRRPSPWQPPLPQARPRLHLASLPTTTARPSSAGPLTAGRGRDPMPARRESSRFRNDSPRVESTRPAQGRGPAGVGERRRTGLGRAAAAASVARAPRGVRRRAARRLPGWAAGRSVGTLGLGYARMTRMDDSDELWIW